VPLAGLAFLLGTGVAGVLAALLAAVYALLPEGPPRPPERSLSHLALRTFSFVVVLLLAVYLGALLLEARGLELPALGSRAAPLPAGEATGSQPGRFPWPTLWLGALTTAAVLAAVVVRSRSPRRATADHPPLAAPLSELLDRLVAELVSARDPRTRVVAAYAQMVDLFAAHGYPPRTSEAPGEYLGRALAELGIGGAAAHRLRVLYELARFSPHAIDEDLRDRALSALQALHEELVPP
jgi:hypothetical protein